MEKGKIDHVQLHQLDSSVWTDSHPMSKEVFDITYKDT